MQGSELTLDNIELLTEASLELADSELTPDNLELPAKANPELAPCEKTQCGEVNLTQPPPQPNELNLEATVLQTQHQQTWMDSLVNYLRNGVLPASKNEARSIRFRSARYILYDDKLYKHGLLALLLRCVTNEEATYIIREIYEGIYGNYAGGASLSLQGTSTGLLLAHDEEGCC